MQAASHTNFDTVLNDTSMLLGICLLLHKCSHRDTDTCLTASLRCLDTALMGFCSTPSRPRLRLTQVDPCTVLLPVMLSSVALLSVGTNGKWKGSLC